MAINMAHIAVVQSWQSSRYEAWSRHYSSGLAPPPPFHFFFFLSAINHTIITSRSPQRTSACVKCRQTISGQVKQTLAATYTIRKKWLCSQSKYFARPYSWTNRLHIVRVLHFIYVTEQHFGPITTYSALAVINPHRTGSITAENGVSRMWAVEMCVYVCDEFGLKGCESASSGSLSLMHV